MKKLIAIFILTVLCGGVFAQTTTTPPGGYTKVTLLSEPDPVLSASGKAILILADVLPWGSNSVQSILTGKGKVFSTATSANIPSLDFSLYDLIIVLSDQPPAFYAVYHANLNKFVDFVQSGRVLQLHACHSGWEGFSGPLNLPGGGSTVFQFENYNNVILPSHPVVSGLSNPFDGGYASHQYFTGLLPGTTVITTGQTSGQPTTIEYSLGSGVVIATTTTLEIAHAYGWENILENLIDYTLGISKPVPLSNWSLYLSILLMTGFVIIRMKKLL